MGIETLFAKPDLSKPSDNPEHRVFPYLLRGLIIARPNQAWDQAERSSCRVDITYIRLVSGWVYLVAFLDWYSRFVVAWESRWKRVSTASDTLEMGFVITCSSVALKVTVPEIVNSDQGSHFTSQRFTEPLLEAGAKISMDGRGRYVDNIFTERLWRSVKYEEVYLSEYETPRDARQGLSRYLSFYNEKRLHRETPPKRAFS